MRSSCGGIPWCTGEIKAQALVQFQPRRGLALSLRDRLKRRCATGLLQMNNDCMCSEPRVNACAYGRIEAGIRELQRAQATRAVANCWQASVTEDRKSTRMNSSH